jgi:hypothetical protein
LVTVCGQRLTNLLIEKDTRKLKVPHVVFGSEVRSALSAKQGELLNHHTGGPAPTFALNHAATCDGLAGGIAKNRVQMLEPNH